MESAVSVVADNYASGPQSLAPGALGSTTNYPQVAESEGKCGHHTTCGDNLVSHYNEALTDANLKVTIFTN
jgi:hypothetical protein